jgi:hypothetical protein
MCAAARGATTAARRSDTAAQTLVFPAAVLLPGLFQVNVTAAKGAFKVASASQSLRLRNGLFPQVTATVRAHARACSPRLSPLPPPRRSRAVPRCWTRSTASCSRPRSVRSWAAARTRTRAR